MADLNIGSYPSIPMRARIRTRVTCVYLYGEKLDPWWYLDKSRYTRHKLVAPGLGGGQVCWELELL